MAAKFIQNSIFYIQSTIITGTLVYLTIATKPSDVYKRVDNMEMKVVQMLEENQQRYDSCRVQMEEIVIWNKGTNQQLSRIQNQLDSNTAWIKNKTKDRWTQEDHEQWERLRFGDVLEIEGIDIE